MNKVILMECLVRNPEIKYGTGENATAIARYTLAVDRRGRKDDGGQNADFIGYIAFGKSAEFDEKYFRKGTKIAITGRTQIGSNTNRDGQKVYTTDVVVEEQEFAESKNAGSGGEYQQRNNAQRLSVNPEGFVSIQDGMDDELPFAKENKIYEDILEKA